MIGQDNLGRGVFRKYTYSAQKGKDILSGKTIHALTFLYPFSVGATLKQKNLTAGVQILSFKNIPYFKVISSALLKVKCTINS